MICVHIYEQLGRYDYQVLPVTVFRNGIEFLGGPLTAPVYMFCMGACMLYTRHGEPKDFFRRGWRLLLTGYALNFFRGTLLVLIAMALSVETDVDPVGSLLLVDILPFAGMAFLAVGIMKKLKLSALRMCIVAFLMQAVGIWGTKLEIGSVTAQALIGLFLPTGVWTGFPLTLWLVYPTLGLLFAEKLQQAKDKAGLSRALLAVSVVFFAAFTAALAYSGYDIRRIYALCEGSYYFQTAIHVLWTLPLIVMALGFWYFIFPDGRIQGLANGSGIAAQTSTGSISRNGF